MGAIALAAFIFTAAVVLYLRSAPSAPVRLAVPSSEKAGRGEAIKDAPVREVVVHVAGAIKAPGIYRLQEGGRVDDAIRAAGGPLPSGLVHELNLAARLVDGQKIIVPAAAPAAGQAGSAAAADRAGGGAHPGRTAGAPGRGPASAPAAGGGGGVGASAGFSGDTPADAGGGLLDLNAATAEQLEELPGVGPAIAGRILEYRKSHGEFRAVAELQQVKGIGPKKFRDIKGKVAVGP